MQFRKKDLLGIKQLEADEIEVILETAETYNGPRDSDLAFLHSPAKERLG